MLLRRDCRRRRLRFEPLEDRRVLSSVPIILPMNPDLSDGDLAGDGLPDGGDPDGGSPGGGLPSPGPAQADLAPYWPPNWDDLIPIGVAELDELDPHDYAGPYHDDRVLWYNWAVGNFGDASALGYRDRFEITGPGGYVSTTGPVDLTAGYLSVWPRDLDVGPLSPGEHTFKLWIDYTDVVDESDETNNYYERTIQVLPTRGDVAGVKWNDLDGDGVRDDGEGGLENWMVYLDYNADGTWNDGEARDWTDADGNYLIEDAPAGTHVVAEEPNGAWSQTYPGPLPTEPPAAAPPTSPPPPLGERPLGATMYDAAEFMLGDVAVSVVLFESDGSIDAQTEDWTLEEIGRVKTEIADGLAWWEETLAGRSSRHELDFHVDFTYADAPVATGYEPISHSGLDDGLWIGDFLDGVGYGTSSMFADLARWNDDRRKALPADWAFTIFVVDSSADLDGRFADGDFAFAYFGGPYLRMTYDNNGWGIGDMSIVTAHETGHVFWALDEYAGTYTYDDRSGYYGTRNENAVDGHPDPSSRVESLMAEALLQPAAYANHASSPSSLEMIGWRDSDGNGVFDALDVPLELTGTGWFNPADGQYEFTGFSRAVPLANENPNPDSYQHDVTINTVDRIQDRLDGGGWTDRTAYGRYETPVAQSVPVAAGAHRIDFRTVVDQTDVTSPVWSDLFTTVPFTHPVEVVAGQQAGGIDFGSVRDPAAVLGRYVLYEGSAWTGPGAVAPDKAALLPGEAATGANVTNYSAGLNGVAIDVENPFNPAALNASDFEFRTGNGDDPAAWSAAPMPDAVRVDVGEGRDESTRITITWADEEITNGWLEVTVMANTNTGLPEPDVFYFGNAIGEVTTLGAGLPTPPPDPTEGLPTLALVNASDVIAVRDNPRGQSSPAAIDNPFDVNRDRRVDAVDVVLARNGATGPLAALRLITPEPAEPAPPPAVAAGESKGPCPPVSVANCGQAADINLIAVAKPRSDHDDVSSRLLPGSRWWENV